MNTTKLLRVCFACIGLFVGVLMSAPFVFSQAHSSAPIDLGGFYDGIRHARAVVAEEDRNYKRYTSEQHVGIAENILLYQNSDGGWPKNIDFTKILSDGETRSLKDGSTKKGKSTLDNDNTYPQIEYLAHVFLRTGQQKYKDAAEQGINYILKEQRPSGGWRGSDVDAITFNDNVMSGTLRLLSKLAKKREPFRWISDDLQKQAASALQRGIDCVLKCQIKRKGRLTAWGQQHDHQTFESVGARTYELPCITAGESAGVVKFLMEIEKPTEEVIQAVEGAVAWFKSVQINGIRIGKRPLAEPVTIGVRTYRAEPVVIQDSNAPPLWARYYDIETDEPFFANRDGIRVQTFAEIALERRTGYAWYGEWPRRVIETKYPEWRAKQGLAPASSRK